MLTYAPNPVQMQLNNQPDWYTTKAEQHRKIIITCKQHEQLVQITPNP
jgi:hypothetical protein